MSGRNLRLSLGSVLLVVCAVAALAVNRYFHHSTLTPTAGASAAVTVEYAFNANGIMFGSESSPLQFVSATRNGTNLSINGVFTGADDLLAGVTLKVKNNSTSQINHSRIVIDLINGTSQRIVGNLCVPEINDLAAGAERNQLLTTASAESIRQAIANAGGDGTRVLVRVDVVQFDETGWKYGLIHRPDLDDPNHWSPDTSGGRTGLLKEQAKPQFASFKKTASAFTCGYFWGYKTPESNYISPCPACQCGYYNGEDWQSYQGSSGVGPFDYGQVAVGCGGYTPAQCPGCTKTTYMGVCP